MKLRSLLGNMLRGLERSRLVSRSMRRLSLALGWSWRIKKLRPNVSPGLQCVRLLRLNEIDTVIDVGANVGQFAEELIDFGFKGRIISFEPVPEAHTELVKRASRRHGWIVHPRCAIGSAQGSTMINVARSTVFSSLLKIDPKHAADKPDSEILRAEPVEVFTLDDALSGYSLDPHRTFLKVDTQGYEQEVVSGASKLFASGLRGLKIEMTMVPIYEGTGWDFPTALGYFSALGYQLSAISVVSVDESSGLTTTIDGTYFSKSVVP